MKRTLWTILSLTMMLTLLAWSAFAAWAGVESLDYAEGVKLCATPAGSGLCQSGGTGWGGHWASGANIWQGEGTIFAEGTGSVSGDGGNAGDGTEHTRNLANTTTADIVSFQMRHETLLAGRGIRFKILGDVSATTTPWYVELDSGGLTLEGATSVTIVASPAADTWYKVHVSFDTVVGTAKARLDSDSSWSSTVNEAAATTNIGGIALYIVGDPSAGNHGYFDDINAGSNPSAANVPSGDDSAGFFLLLGLYPLPRRIFV